MLVILGKSNLMVLVLWGLCLSMFDLYLCFINFVEIWEKFVRMLIEMSFYDVFCFLWK